MNFRFRHKRISGLTVVLPERESNFEDEIKNYDFPEANSRKLQKVVGLGSHRIVEDNTCASDLALFGMKRLIADGLLNPEDIDALVMITETPDYFMPPTSNVIQGKLGLGQDVLCLDINQGCAGFIVGLIQGFLLLDQDCINKVVLVTADTLSRTASKRDRNSYPLLGDAAAITILDGCEAEATIHASLKMDGTRHEAIMIPAGGFRLPTTAETSQEKAVGDGNYRSQSQYHMDGIAVFQFVQNDVPKLIDELLEWSGWSKQEIDYFMFHQPNRFLLEKLADQMAVPRAKVPNDVVERYGGASSATVPTVVAHTLGTEAERSPHALCLGGFGVGLTWGAVVLKTDPLDFCTFMDYPLDEDQ